MVNLLQSALENGTGAPARTRGFRLPAAGKTGTSHDGWFAGFTSNLLAVAWVGFDDDRDLNLTGAQSALPLWTEFMKRAMDNPAYRNAQPFTAPPGVVTVPVEEDVDTADGSGPPKLRIEAFIRGTEPSASADGVAAAAQTATVSNNAPSAVAQMQQVQPRPEGAVPWR